MAETMAAAQNGTAPPPNSSFPAADLAARIRGELLPHNERFHYFFLSGMPSEEDTREYLQEPIAALPPRVASLLPRIALIFVPYLEKRHGRKNAELVSLARPAKPVYSARVDTPDQQFLLFPFEDRDVGEYHYRFYQAIAENVADAIPAEIDKSYLALIKQELKANVHGEVDEPSWERKIDLLERQSLCRGTNKQVRDYARQSFIDTMTLYLHGICCDLDVDTGPRQLASRHLRKRLELLEEMFAPPKGYAVFPEELKD